MKKTYEAIIAYRENSNLAELVTEGKKIAASSIAVARKCAKSLAELHTWEAEGKDYVGRVMNVRES